MVERPARGGLLDRLETRIGRHGSAQHELAFLGQQQDSVHAQQPADFAAQQLRQFVGLADAGELARETGQRAVLGGAALGQQSLIAHARGKLAARHGHAEQHEHGQDVLGILDGEGARRRDEEEIIGQRRNEAGDDADAQAVARGHDHDGQEEQQADIGDVAGREQRRAKQCHQSNKDKRGKIVGGPAPIAPSPERHAAHAGRSPAPSAAHGWPRSGVSRHQPVDDRAMAQLEPARADRLADDELRRARLGREAHDAPRPPSARGQSRPARQAGLPDAASAARRALSASEKWLARGVSIWTAVHEPRSASAMRLVARTSSLAPGCSLMATTMRSPAAQVPARA